MRPPHARTRTVQYAAEVLDLDVKTIRKLLISGELPGRKFGNKWLLLDKALDEYVESLGRRSA